MSRQGLSIENRPRPLARLAVALGGPQPAFALVLLHLLSFFSIRIFPPTPTGPDPPEAGGGEGVVGKQLEGPELVPCLACGLVNLSWDSLCAWLWAAQEPLQTSWLPVTSLNTSHTLSPAGLGAHGCVLAAWDIPPPSSLPSEPLGLHGACGESHHLCHSSRVAGLRVYRLGV